MGPSLHKEIEGKGMTEVRRYNRSRDHDRAQGNDFV